MKTYYNLLKEGEKLLFDAEISDYKYDSFLLLENVFNINRTEFFMKKDEEITDIDKINTYISLIGKRSTKIPLQHITGKQEFMGLEFLVNEHTLIPRQDTEILVETLIEEAKKHNKKGLNILDVCTGSGCIGISIAHFLKDSRVCAVDISEDALLVALKNKELNHLENINFIKSDLFSSLDNEKFDIIVSNPPYIRTKEIEKLMEEVKIHEPFIALDGKEDGLYFYREITKKSIDFLKNGSNLMYEIGFDQAKDVSDILLENGFKDIKVIKDLPGHDRVVIGVYNK